MLKNISLSLISLLLMLVCAEIFFRVYPATEICVNNPYKYVGEVGRWINTPYNTFTHIYPLKYDRRSYYKKSNGKIYYFYNQFGARWISPTEQNIEGRNVIVLGDSFTIGHGLRYEDTYICKLQDKLRKEKFNINFINFSEPGANSIRCNQIYNSIKYEEKHEFLLYALHINDLIEFPTSFVVNSNHQSKLASFLIDKSKLVEFILRKKNQYIDRKKKIEYLTNPLIFTKEYFRVNMDAIINMKKQAELGGRKFYVVILPFLVDVKKGTFTPVYNRIKKLFNEYKINYLDLSESVKSYNDSELWILPFDQHPNELANEIFVNQLYPKFKDILFN